MTECTRPKRASAQARIEMTRKTRGIDIRNGKPVALDKSYVQIVYIPIGKTMPQ